MVEYTWGGLHEDEPDSIELLINGAWAGFVRKAIFGGGYEYYLEPGNDLDDGYDNIEQAKKYLLEKAKEWVERTLFYVREYNLLQ